ncbi:MAG: alpha/beta fold hydrolase [Gemmobacter sp.]
MHASLSYARQWRGMLAHLPDWQADCVDLPGHGGAPDWDGIADYGDAATGRAALALGERTDVLVGHSFGAVVALRLALEHPGRIGRLVLIEPVLFAAARGTPDALRHGRASAPFAAAMEAGNRDRAARAFTAVWGEGRPWDSLPETVRAGLADRIHLVAAAGPMLNNDRAGLLAPGRMEALRLPVLLIEGAESPAVIATIHDRLAARLPQALRARIPGAGHMLPVTHPAETAAALDSFG